MKRLLLVALMVLVTLVGMVGLSRAAELQNIQQSMCPVIECILVSALQATAKATDGAVGTLQATVNDGGKARAKMYYLTKNTFNGGDAIKACDPRFHMASISEIQDPSNLQYVNRSTTVYDSLVDDQGLDPPSNRMGWVRTGSFPLAGVPDYCDFRMSSSDQQSGTTMSRRTLWDLPSTELHASVAPSWWCTQRRSRPLSQSLSGASRTQNEERDLHRNDRSARR